MRNSAAGRRYARALFGLAKDTGAIDGVRRELDDMFQLLSDHPELHRALFRPLHPVEQRRAVLSAVCQRISGSEIVSNFYSVLIDQRRLVDFESIREEFNRLADEAAGQTRAEVVSATPLSDDQRERLRSALAARTGRQIQLEASVDPELIGGAIATVGGLVFDGSIRTQLHQLRAALTRGH